MKASGAGDQRGAGRSGDQVEVGGAGDHQGRAEGMRVHQGSAGESEDHQCRADRAEGCHETKEYQGGAESNGGADRA